MNMYETLSGLHRAAAEAQAEARRVEQIVREVGAKIGDPRTPLAIRDEWHPVCREWGDFAHSSPLLRERDPRMTREDLRDAYQRVVALKTRVLGVYRSWKSWAASASLSGAPAPAARTAGALPGVPASGAGEGKLLRGVLIGAAVVSGCAAATVLFGAFRKKEAPPAPVPPPRALPQFGGYGMPMMSATPHPMMQMMVPAPLYPQGYRHPEMGNYDIE